MAKEIEKRFLLQNGVSIPIPDNFTKSNIKQGYILVKDDKHLRVRITTYINKSYDIPQAMLCLKYTNKIVRDEFEYDIPLEDAKTLYKKCLWFLEKKRLSFSLNGVKYDIDTYPNKLIVVETEFKSIKQMKAWKKPSWIGDEITGIAKFSNIGLSKRKLKFK